MNLASFADLAVRLVNSGACDADADPLRSCEAFRAFVRERQLPDVCVTPADLDRLRQLRTELTGIFVAASQGDDHGAVNALNALLMIHPVHPVLVQHDGEPWHVHLSESGTMADRYAAASVIGLSLMLSALGAERLGRCAIASCGRVYIDGSTNKSRRYCAAHSAAKANVTSLRGQRRSIQGGTRESVA